MATSLSIIIPSFNRGRTIERTIKSVLGQDYRNTELIIIDGGSTDGTLEVLAKYGARISYQVSERDLGLYHAINKGILAATGEFVGVIATDDWYEPGAFQKIDKYVRDHSSAQWILGRLKIVTAEGRLIKETIVDASRFPNVIRANHPTWFVRRDVYNTYGGYSLRYPIAADLDMLYRLCGAGLRAHAIEETIATHSLGGVSTDPVNKNMVYLQVAAIKYRHGALGFGVYVKEITLLSLAEAARRGRVVLSLIKRKLSGMVRR